MGWLEYDPFLLGQKAYVQARLLLASGSVHVFIFMSYIDIIDIRYLFHELRLITFC